jgi:type IV secretion system protein VirB6
MAGACPALTPQDPLVRGLLGVVDCNVQTLAHGGYAALFGPSAAFGGVLTAALVIYVALIGYRLMLGRSAMGVGDFALTAVKLGAVLALATQWATYQAVVYDTLFHGPEQIATAVLDGMQPQGSQFRGNVFVGLQRAFDDLSAGAGSYANHTPQIGATQSGPAALAAAAAASTTPTTGQQLGGLLSADSFGALLLVGTAAVLLISTLGVLLAAKIVLAVLLGIGPIFIALFLFDATRGLFEGF